MALVTDYNTVAVTIPLSPVPTRLFMGRPDRIVLVIAAAPTSITFVATQESDFNNHIFARLPSATTLVMPIRDYGPLITGEIWVNSVVGNLLVNGSEIFPIARSK